MHETRMMMSMGVVLLFVDLFDCLDRDFVLFVEPVIYLWPVIYGHEYVITEVKFKFFKKKEQNKNDLAKLKTK